MKRVVLVTGGNRGIGFALCQKLAEMDYTVILTARDTSKGVQKTALLEERGFDVTFCKLDVTNPDNIAEVYKTVEKKWGRLDILINNAGVLLDNISASKHPSGLFQTDFSVLETTLNANVVGPYLLCEVFFPMMKAQNYGRIVNLTSGLGQLSHMGSGYPAYRISKTAINAVTKIFSSLGRSANILVNSVDPGWVQTDMGGLDAPKTIQEALEGIVWAATLPEGGPSGKLFRDGEPQPW